MQGNINQCYRIIIVAVSGDISRGTLNNCLSVTLVFLILSIWRRRTQPQISLPWWWLEMMSHKHIRGFTCVSFPYTTTFLKWRKCKILTIWDTLRWRTVSFIYMSIELLLLLCRRHWEYHFHPLGFHKLLVSLNRDKCIDIH